MCRSQFSEELGQTTAAYTGRIETGVGHLSVVGTQPPGNEHRDLHRLLIVKPRIDLRFVGACKIGLPQTTGAADTLCDVLPRQLQVHAAQVAP